MVGQKVTHTIFGVGIIKTVDEAEGFIIVEFESSEVRKNKTLKFPYPDIFRSFITAKDNGVQKEILAGMGIEYKENTEVL